MSTVNWEAVRARFPACSNVTYLNAAGGSPMCADAAIEGKRYFDEMLLYGDVCWDEWLERTKRVRYNLARFIGAWPDETGFASNTSTAMGYVARLFQKGDHVLTMADEFPSSTFPMINAGLKIDFVEPVNGGYPVEAIEKVLRPHHKVLLTSYVQYRTGFRQQLKIIGTFCKANNILFAVNATQAMGMFPIDVVSDHIDFLVFSGLKWTCAGYGAAGMYIRKGLLGNDSVPMAGWRSVDDPEAMDNQNLRLSGAVADLEAGCPSFPTIFALGGAIDLINNIGPQNCTRRVLELSLRLESMLREQGLPVLHSFETENRSGIIMVRCNLAKLLVEELAKKNILVSARGEGLRISVSIYNNENDLVKLVEGLKQLAYLIQ